MFYLLKKTQNKIQNVLEQNLQPKKKEQKTQQHNIMVLGLSNVDEVNNRKSCQIITNKSLEAILARKSIDERQRGFLNSRSIFTAEDNRLVTVPIKEYSNKFLRDKRREEAEGGVRKKEPFPNSHLHNNRKLISEFKKYKGRNQKFRKSVNKQNGDFIIYNLLLQKQDSMCPTHSKPHKTIFGTFTQNPHQTPKQQQSTLIQKHFTATTTQSIFQSRKQLYQKICQKQKALIPQYRKKCKTIADVVNIQDKRIEKISTSRALEKYSKIVKVNPEHGKIEKMRIKKELAKSLRLEAGENNQIQTKKIVLGQKHNAATKRKATLLPKDIPQRPASIDHTQRQNHSIMQMARTPQKSVQNFITSKVGLFTSAGRFRKVRKFSHQVESNKKCMTEESKLREDETFGDFEINGWDINF